MKRYHLLLVATCVAIISFGGRSTLRVDHASKPPHRITEPEFLKKTRPQWADSVLATLSLEDRIAQLMMVAAWSNKSHAHENDIGELIKQHNIGGLIFLQGGPNRQAALTNRYQGLARTPLLIGQDLEWGLAMRLDSTMRFPKEMTLGAMESDRGIEAMGAEIARQMHRLGVQVSFSPVADVNIDPANPVINDRSFGEDREAVARKAIAYMRGLQNGGVIATAKHFPGHGDTDTDSHLGLPMIAQPRARLDSVELYPFRRLIAEGLNAVMVAHLEVHALDTTAHLPSTLSKPIVTGLLQDEMGFHGLVFTDALNMKGVSEAVPAKARRSGEIELRALLAGNDVLLFPQDPVKAIERIKQAVDSGEIAREVIDAKCLKLLRAKEWAGLSHLRPVEVANIAEELAPVSAKALRRSLFADALTLLRNDGTLPIANVGKQRIASLVIGDSLHCTFQRDLERYAPITEFRCDKIMKRDSAEALLHKLKDFDLVIASVHNTSFKSEKEYGIPQLTLDFLRRLGDQNKMAFVLFANPYRLVQAYGAQRWNAMICAYEENDDTQDLTAQALFGAIPMSGTLPVTASAFFKKGDGIRLTAIQRLSYALPEEDSVSTGDLRGIDTVVGEGIAAKAFPGCEVLVAHNGKVIWNKAYGSPTYDNARAVRTDDIYDLASVTKVASTTLAVMKLVDEKKLDLDKTLGDYMPDWKSAHPLHARMLFRDVLTHQAGLKAFVPFYLKLLKDGKLKPGIAADSADAKHPLRVAMGIYLPAAYRDSVIKWMFDAPVGPRGDYVYSDFTMYLMMLVVERITGTSLDRYVNDNFYKPLGLGTIGYQPLIRFPKDRIMPTENDTEFRHQLVQGDVHDPGAAMLGGVGGHAGLFSDAGDLAVIMQMLINGGSYGGTRFFSDGTVAEFTRCQCCSLPSPTGKENRRGLGWDKPQPHGKEGPACDCVSYASFGHTGFTGTMVWADPEKKLVYIFLSNRVNPSAANKKIQELNIRTRIQQVIYDAIEGKSVAIK